MPLLFEQRDSLVLRGAEDPTKIPEQNQTRNQSLKSFEMDGPETPPKYSTQLNGSRVPGQGEGTNRYQHS